MVDVSEKAVTAREAVARGRITMSRRRCGWFAPARSKRATRSRRRGSPASWRPSRRRVLIPLCHPLNLSHVDVTLTAVRDGYIIEARVRTTDRTGVEMEALTAVAVAALTIYDMVKAVDKAMMIGDIRLIEKRGGRSGEYRA